MGFLKLFILAFATRIFISKCEGANSNLFQAYIGADSNTTKFSEVPVYPAVDFHFILSFAIDYFGKIPTNGKFNIFWETTHLNPAQVRSIKAQHKNIKVALSLGGDTITKNHFAYFEPKSISSWVQNAVSSLTAIIKDYDLDGIDIDYEHFKSHPNTFAECIGQLITILKKNQVISFASIAPFDNAHVQTHYQALWRRYGYAIDYVNFQFYAYDEGTSISQFLGYFDEQSCNYEGGKLMASFSTDGSGGLSPSDGFFEACKELKKEGKLEGIFVWSADDSKKYGFRYEKQSQELLSST